MIRCLFTLRLAFVRLLAISAIAAAAFAPATWVLNGFPERTEEEECEPETAQAVCLVQCRRKERPVAMARDGLSCRAPSPDRLAAAPPVSRPRGGVRGHQIAHGVSVPLLL